MTQLSADAQAIVQAILQSGQNMAKSFSQTGGVGTVWIDASQYSTIQAADAAAVAAGQSLVVSSLFIVNTNTTLSSSIIVLKGGGFTKSAIATLTINGPFSAGLYQVFSGFNAGDVTFGAGSVKEVVPQWWGTTWSDSISAASASLINGGSVYFSPGTYTVTSQAVLQNNIRYYGAGVSSVLQVGNATTNIFSNQNSNYLNVVRLSNIQIDHLSFDGNYNAFGDPLNDALTFGVYIQYSDGITVEDCYFKNFWYDAINIFGSRSFTITRNNFQHCGDKNTYLGYYRAIAFDGAASGPIYGVSTGLISHNIIQNCGLGIGSVSANSNGIDVDISDNIIQATKIQGIGITDGGWQRLSICGNKIYQAGDSAISVSTNNTAGTHTGYLAKEVLIQSNLIDSPSFINTGAVGVRADGVSVLNISDNKILNINQATARGILIGQAYEQDGSLKTTTGAVIKGNHITSTTATDGININSAYTRVTENAITGTFSSAGVKIAAGAGNFAGNNYIPMSNPIIDSGTNSDFSNNRISTSPMASAFQLAAAATTTVSNGNVLALAGDVDRIAIYPVNASAAALMGSAKHLRFSSSIAGTSFTLATGDGTNAAGTEIFYYVIY